MAKPVYGADHRRWAKRLPNPNGQPCPKCGLPMFTSQHLELGHVIATEHGGGQGRRQWEHRSCNRADGARIGNAKRHKHIRYQEPDQHSQDW